MQQLKQTLLRLLDAPGPSGFENAASEVWRDIAREFADDVWTDVQGNSFASNAAEGAPTVMLAGHVDEIGIMVHYIDDEGFLYVRGVGGWDAQVLVGQRIELLTRDGPLPGVVGRKAIHLMKPEERTQAVKLSDLWLDIGAASGDDARRLVAIGDVGTIRSETVIIGDTIVVARSVDDRSGTAVVLEALRRLCGRPIAPRVVAVATTHEEIGAHLGGGARTSSFQLNPEVAIVLDVTHATDHPHADKREYGDVRLGGGPVLSRGAVLNPRLVDGLEEAARRVGTDIQWQATPSATGTDADDIFTTRAGIATALVSIPNRYMHSPNELVDLRDLDAAAELIAEYLTALDESVDFSAG